MSQSATTTDTDQTAEYAGAEQGGFLRATVVTEPPSDAPVTEFNESDISNPLLTDAVEASYENHEYSTDVTSGEIDSMTADLAHVPAYNGSKFGHYLRYRDRVVRIRMIQYG